MNHRLLIALGLVLGVLPAMLRHFLLWPFPGAQTLDSAGWAYALEHALPWLRLVGAMFLLSGIFRMWTRMPERRTALWIGLLGVLVAGLHLLMFRTSAYAVFAPQPHPTFAQGTSEALPSETLVMGLRLGQEARAYPVRLLAYHHQVRDEVNGQRLWVTYCTMCKTGKVFLREIDGRPAEFEMVGAIRYNSVYKDTLSGSYWYQANGRAVAGPWEGKTLAELRTDLMTLEHWLELYPESLVMQPDPAHAEGYEMFGFDEYDEQRSDVEDPPEWQWVVGLVEGDEARAYPWAWLAGEGLVQDEMAGRPIAIHLRSDGVSHRVWDRRVEGRVLDLRLDREDDQLVDEASGTVFGFDGVGQGGDLAGVALEAVSSTVEFQHSFGRFSKGVMVEIPEGAVVAGNDETTPEDAEVATPEADDSEGGGADVSPSEAADTPSDEEGSSGE